MASSRSVVPAMGLLGVVGGAGAGGGVRTAASGVGSRTRSQHTHPSPLYATSFLDLKRPLPRNFCHGLGQLCGPPLPQGFRAWTY